MDKIYSFIRACLNCVKKYYGNIKQYDVIISKIRAPTLK